MTIQEKIENYTQEILAYTPVTAEEIEGFRLRFLVNKGIVKQLLKNLDLFLPKKRKL